MRPTNRSTCALLATLALAVALAACGGGGSGDPDPGADGGAGSDAGVDEWQDRLNEREVDHSAALRVAALRLTGDLPTLAEIKFVADAGDPQAAYEALVAQYLDDPRFARQILAFWRDTFKMGDDALLETAPTFAAQLTVENRSFLELLTASAGTCPTFDGAAFTPGDCANGVALHAGVLTNPGVMKQFVSNLAFRRVRWVQEVFDCTAFPAEVTTPQEVGGPSLYTGPWPFDSIAGAANGGTIDFLDVSAVVCANCHVTMNHMAPLFANFDADGTYQPQIAVTTPAQGTPLALLSDWLPPGETTAWRYGAPAADLPALGAAMAADPAVAECAVARAWNWAFGKGDIVATLALVPPEVIEQQVDAFIGGGHKLKDLLYTVFTSEDFVKF